MYGCTGRSENKGTQPRDKWELKFNLCSTRQAMHPGVKLYSPEEGCGFNICIH